MFVYPVEVLLPVSAGEQYGRHRFYRHCHFGKAHSPHIVGRIKRSAMRRMWCVARACGAMRCAYWRPTECGLRALTTSASADSSVADKLIFKALAFCSSSPFMLTLVTRLDVWVLETMTKVAD